MYEKEKGGITIKKWKLLRTLKASIGCALRVKIICGLAIKGLRLLLSGSAEEKASLHHRNGHTRERDIRVLVHSAQPWVTAPSLCLSFSQASSLQPPVLRLPPGLALRLAAPAADNWPVHTLHGSCTPEGLQRGRRAEKGVRVFR